MVGVGVGEEQELEVAGAVEIDVVDGDPSLVVKRGGDVGEQGGREEREHEDSGAFHGWTRSVVEMLCVEAAASESVTVPLAAASMRKRGSMGSRVHLSSRKIR